MRAAVIALVAAIAFLCVGCFGAGAQSPAQSSVQVRAEARAVVSLAADTWNAVAGGCLAMADDKQDDSIRAKCAAVLIPLHATIEAAANSVDAWSAAEQANFPCFAADIVTGLTQVEQLVSSLGVDVPPLIQDALALAKGFAPSCAQDSGPNARGVNPYGAAQ